MTLTATDSALAYYAAHGAALFPIPAGQKSPIGIVESFARDHSTDPARWSQWFAEHHCNFGIVAGPSRLVIVDIDTKAGRDAAWAMWCELCTAWNIPVASPHVETPSGGWHVYFSVPADVDATALRQPDAIKKHVNIRAANGFTVCAGSTFEGRPYTLLNDVAPYPAPAALIEHCTRRAPSPSTAPAINSYDPADVANLLRWLNDRGAFSAYEDWLNVGMALKLEFGDAGLDLWALTHDETVTDDVIASKWRSFSTEPSAHAVTLNTFLARAHSMGWHQTVRKSMASMFGDTVAQLAANAGASLASGAVPLLDTQRVVAALGQTVLDNFLAGTVSGPLRAADPSHATLPDVMGAHPLFEPMQDAIGRVVAMAEGGSKTFRQDRVLSTLAVLHAMHPQTCVSLCQRVTALGGVMSPGRLDSAIKNFEGRVRVEMATAAGFITDSKGMPASDNSDNVHVFVRQRGVQLRYNIWTDQPEVKDGESDFVPMTDHIFGDLLMDAKNSQFNYHPAEGLFRRGLVSNARKTMHDPLLERIDRAASRWDGKPRLATWLTIACGVPCDIYHQAVGRNLIGGMIRRAREPGCKQDETVIFISPQQGTGKSTLCEILALQPEWFTDSFKFGGSQQNTIPQLAGKWIVELGELAGMNQTEVEDVKHFLSGKTDNYVRKYEAFSTEQKRRCVFIGTSNDRRPLRDATGNRRFLPVQVQGEINLEWLRANVEQLIGEAAVRYAAGEQFAIPRSVWEEAARHQEAARTKSAVEELIYQWFDLPATANVFITSGDLLHALKLAGQSAHYGRFMEKLGYRSRPEFVASEGKKARVWYRGNAHRIDETFARMRPRQTSPANPVEMVMSLERPIAVASVPPPPVPMR